MCYNLVMHKIAVVIYGPPGSGKGTQANLLALSHGLIHFDSGRFIEFLLKDPRNAGDPVIDRQRALFEKGELCETEWVMDVIGRQTKKIVAADFGIVLSGSPRTFFEAFGDDKTKGILPLLQEAYGKEDVHVVFLRVEDKVSIERNSHRKLCTTCGTQLINNPELVNPFCPFCGGSLYTRVFDNEAKIVIRLEEFRKKTLPILEELPRRGIKLAEVNGELLPYLVHREIVEKSSV